MVDSVCSWPSSAKEETERTAASYGNREKERDPRQRHTWQDKEEKRAGQMGKETNREVKRGRETQKKVELQGTNEPRGKACQGGADTGRERNSEGNSPQLQRLVERASLARAPAGPGPWGLDPSPAPVLP